MATSQTRLSDHEARDIFAIGRFIERHVTDTWQVILQAKHDKLVDVFQRAGDGAYGTYGNLLFRPVMKQLLQAKVRASPRLPGDFNSSREWGNEDESDQQRWMWSTILTTTGEPLGTIVTIYFHDHTRFRIPRPPQIIALRETTKDAVVEELSRRSPDFAKAVEFSVWYAEYLRSTESAGSA